MYNVKWIMYNFFMNYDFLKSVFKLAHISFVENEPLKNKNTFKIDSTAKLFVTPNDAEQLRSAIGGAATSDANFFILGGGSNIVFPDNEYKGIIISTQNLNSIYMDDEAIPGQTVYVTCQAGTPTAAFVNFCTKKNLSGAEQFAGLPGTIGGAVYMNARCFNKSICEIIHQTEHIDYQDSVNTKIITSEFDASEWDYKKSPFQNGKKVITQVTFALSAMPAEKHPEIESVCKKFIAERVDKGHFKFPSAGSVFKNNHDFGAPSGKIIDDAGLRGYAIGGAQVAPFHGNFIINTGNATAENIKELVQYVQKVVQEKTGFLLEPEIIFI